MASGGGKLGKVRPAAKSVIRVEKTPPLLPQPFSVPFNAQAKLKQASPDVSFTDKLEQKATADHVTEHPIEASKKFSYDAVHIKQRADALLDTPSPLPSDESFCSGRFTPAHLRSIPWSDSDSSCDSVSPDTRVNAVAVTLEDVQVIHL
jgi:hypothetical protein